MSVFKRANSQFYQYDFVLHGRRFLGSTKTRNKKDALTVEAGIREQAKKDIATEKATGKGL